MVAFLRAWAGHDDDEVELVLDALVQPVSGEVTRELFGVAVAQIRTSATLSGLGVETILQALWKPNPREPVDGAARPAVKALITALALADDELVAIAQPMVDEVSQGEVIGLLADLIIGYYSVLEDTEGTSVSASLDDLERALGLR